jgi:hypothetical protein
MLSSLRLYQNALEKTPSIIASSPGSGKTRTYAAFCVLCKEDGFGDFFLYVTHNKLIQKKIHKELIKNFGHLLDIQIYDKNKPTPQITGIQIMSYSDLKNTYDSGTDEQKELFTIKYDTIIFDEAEEMFPKNIITSKEKKQSELEQQFKNFILKQKSIIYGTATPADNYFEFEKFHINLLPILKNPKHKEINEKCTYEMRNSFQLFSYYLDYNVKLEKQAIEDLVLTNEFNEKTTALKNLYSLAREIHGLSLNTNTETVLSNAHLVFNGLLGYIKKQSEDKTLIDYLVHAFIQLSNGEKTLIRVEEYNASEKRLENALEIIEKTIESLKNNFNQNTEQIDNLNKKLENIKVILNNNPFKTLSIQRLLNINQDDSFYARIRHEIYNKYRDLMQNKQNIQAFDTLFNHVYMLSQNQITSEKQTQKEKKIDQVLENWGIPTLSEKSVDILITTPAFDSGHDFHAPCKNRIQSNQAIIGESHTSKRWIQFSGRMLRLGIKVKPKLLHVSRRTNDSILSQNHHIEKLLRCLETSRGDTSLLEESNSEYYTFLQKQQTINTLVTTIGHLFNDIRLKKSSTPNFPKLLRNEVTYNDHSTEIIEEIERLYEESEKKKNVILHQSETTQLDSFTLNGKDINISIETVTDENNALHHFLTGNYLPLYDFLSIMLNTHKWEFQTIVEPDNIKRHELKIPDVDAINRLNRLKKTPDSDQPSLFYQWMSIPIDQQKAMKNPFSPSQNNKSKRKNVQQSTHSKDTKKFKLFFRNYDDTEVTEKPIDTIIDTDDISTIIEKKRKRECISTEKQNVKNKLAVYIPISNLEIQNDESISKHFELNKNTIQKEYQKSLIPIPKPTIESTLQKSAPSLRKLKKYQADSKKNPS